MQEQWEIVARKNRTRHATFCYSRFWAIICIVSSRNEEKNKKSRVKDIRYGAVRNALVLTTVRITANLDKSEKIIHLSEYKQAWDISLGENWVL